MDAVRTIEIDAEAETRLRALADRWGVTAGQAIGELLDQQALLDTDPAPDDDHVRSEEFLRSCRDAIDEAERIGWVDGAEMSEWLRKTARGEDLPLPEPRLSLRSGDRERR